jgi:hypothetical protein
MTGRICVLACLSGVHSDSPLPIIRIAMAPPLAYSVPQRTGSTADMSDAELCTSEVHVLMPCAHCPYHPDHAAIFKSFFGLHSSIVCHMATRTASERSARCGLRAQLSGEVLSRGMLNKEGMGVPVCMCLVVAR